MKYSTYQKWSKFKRTIKGTYYNNEGKFVLGGLAGIMLCGSIVLGGHTELERQFRLLDDPYKNMTTEQVVKAVATYDQAKDYLVRHLRYRDVNTPGTPLDQIHGRGEGTCTDGAVVAIALLSDDPQYEVKNMDLDSRLQCVVGSTPLKYFFGGHAVALVRDKKTDKYGSLGINPTDCIEPKLDNPEQVYDKLNLLKMFKGYKFRDLENNKDAIYGTSGEGAERCFGFNN